MTARRLGATRAALAAPAVERQRRRRVEVRWEELALQVRRGSLAAIVTKLAHRNQDGGLVGRRRLGPSCREQVRSKRVAHFVDHAGFEVIKTYPVDTIL